MNASPHAPAERRWTTGAAIATAITLWASAFVCTRVVLMAGTINPLQLAFVRYLLAALVLAGLAAVLRVRRPMLADIPRLLACGLLAVTAYNGLLNWGQSMMRAGAASFIVNTLPLFTLFFSVLFLGDRMRLAGVVGMITSFVGIVMIGYAEGRELEINIGAVAVLAAAICWSLATIIQKPLLVRYRPLDMVCYMIWSGALFLGLMAPGSFDALRAAGGRELALIVYLGVFPAVVAYICWAHVLSRWTASRASSFLYLVPVLATSLEIVWLRDWPGLLMLAGGGVTLGGVILTATFGRPRGVTLSRVAVPLPRTPDTTP